MRLVDRDLIRGGHYGQRSCEPHSKAEHMAAPTNAAFVKKVLANSEPSTHGPERRSVPAPTWSRTGAKRTRPTRVQTAVDDPQRHFAAINWCVAKGLFDHIVCKREELRRRS